MTIYAVNTTWQLRLLAKYKVLTVSMVIGGFYALAFYLIPEIKDEKLLSFLIFSDPSMLGFIFVGAMVLFEKTDRTLSALVITPMKPTDYLIGKSLALLIPSMICSIIMVIAARGFDFRLFPFLMATIFTSISYTLFGIAGAVRVNTFNQYIIVIPLFLIPLCLPLLNFFEVVDLKSLYLIPTQASLYLFSQSFHDPDILNELLTSSYLILWSGIALLIAKRAFETKIYQ